jgi:predicted ATPase
MTRGFLRSIKLSSGSLRGLNALDITFNYPIAAIAGKNGAGKSTILALACCAFHALPEGFKLPKRKNSYYTFSDFFINHSAEVPLRDLKIYYTIAFDKWKPSTNLPTGIGLGVQHRTRKKHGKWNEYDTRVHRTVVFLGIERIVPHSERSQSRSYSRVFRDAARKGWEHKVMDAVGYVLGKKYDDFKYAEYSKYSLPIVKCGPNTYSGFNMGAGESALFEIFSTIYSAGPGALLVLDEAELGLHAEAQRKFIDRLKDVSLENSTQVILTTHSKEIFEYLPNDARFYAETVNGKTRVVQGIASDYAFAKLSSIAGLEADIFIEDDVAKALMLAAIPASLRARVTFVVIGSANALARQLAAAYARGAPKPVLAVFDGDQSLLAAQNLDHAKRMAEKVRPDFDTWYQSHSAYLPSQTWPEAWILAKAASLLNELSPSLGAQPDELADVITDGQLAGKHNEFSQVARRLGLERAHCLQVFASVVAQHNALELAPLVSRIEAILS